MELLSRRSSFETGQVRNLGGDEDSRSELLTYRQKMREYGERKEKKEEKRAKAMAIEGGFLLKLSPLVRLPQLPACLLSRVGGERDMFARRL